MCLLEGIWTNIEKHDSKGASPNQKLLNLWIRIQANNQEQGAMPNVNIPTLQAAYVLGGQYQI